MFKPSRLAVLAVCATVLQGCAVALPVAAIGVGMGAGAPVPLPTQDVDGVGVNSQRTTCGDLFGPLGTYQCFNINFTPSVNRTFDDRIRLATRAEEQRLGQRIIVAPRQDIIRVTQRMRRGDDVNTTLFFAYRVE